MITIGLTGSIGMGKSTAARFLKKMGCAVHDSDRVVAHALSPKGIAFEEVALTFPKCWDKRKRHIQKDVLAQIVFNDDQQRRKLERILHPIVQASQKKFAQSQARLGKNIIVFDIPLLFETGAQKRFDYTICVSAPYHIQRRRVLSRPNMTLDRFHSILSIQMPDKIKQKLADYTVQTGMGFSHTHRQLKKIIKDII